MRTVVAKPNVPSSNQPVAGRADRRAEGVDARTAGPTSGPASTRRATTPLATSGSDRPMSDVGTASSAALNTNLASGVVRSAA